MLAVILNYTLSSISDHNSLSFGLNKYTPEDSSHSLEVCVPASLVQAELVIPNREVSGGARTDQELQRPSV